MVFTILSLFFFFNDTATTEIYTLHIVGSVRCVQETGINAEYMGDRQVKIHQQSFLFRVLVMSQMTQRIQQKWYQKKPKKKKKAIFSKQSPKILLFTLYYLRLIMGIGFSAFFTQIKDSLILNSCLTTGAALLSFIPLKIIQLIFYCKNVVSKILFSLIFFGVFGFSLLIAYHYYQSMNKHEATIWGYGSSAMIIVDTILSLLPLRFLKYKFELYFQKQKTVEAQFVIDKILN
eukprot:TRINITY_DN6693_c0_g1_i2.p2 TRINITY_DN6693_c0_g1~~TRINITY_DN6693_c0_g1_i2.p2  ORF type:complete len:233 (+),score=37.81 TRINITY_DN6693_c0_g1_i2:85-783(+)